MASSLFVNTLEVSFTSVLGMEHARMVRLFKALEDTGLLGFLEGTTFVFEYAVTYFFSNARVIEGTIVSTNPRKQSQRYIVQISMLMELLVQADLGTSTKIHAKKVLTSKQVENYIKINQGTTPTEDTASNTEGEPSQHTQQVPPEFTKSLADATEQNVPNPKKRKHKGKKQKTHTQPATTQINTTPPNTTATQNVDNRETVVPPYVDPEEDSDTDSCSLMKRQRRTTQRQPKPSTTQPNPIPALTTASKELPEDQILREGGVDNLDQDLNLNDQTEQDENNDQNGSWLSRSYDNEINFFEQGRSKENREAGLDSDAQKGHERQSESEYITDARAGSSHDPIPTDLNADKANAADNEQMDHGSEEPENTVLTKFARIHPDFASADKYCTPQDLYSFESMVDIEEQLLEWAETEDITELSERRSLILYKLLETELEKLYLAHLASFKTGVLSAHHDFECIRQLHQELRLIAAAHRHHRGLVGLPFTTLESDFVPKFSPALEIYGLTGTTLGSALNTNPLIAQHEYETANAYYEHQAQENESLIQTVGHDIPTQDGQGYEPRVDEGLNAIPISAINPIAEENVHNHQGFNSSILETVASGSMEPSSLQLLTSATQSLTTLYTRVESLDQTYARLRHDTDMTKHHTAQLCDQLKDTADGMDIKIDVLERTITQRLVDELAVVKSQLAILIEDLKIWVLPKRGKMDPAIDQGEGQATAAGQVMYREEVDLVQVVGQDQVLVEEQVLVVDQVLVEEQVLVVDQVLVV
ncbi:hypothetical protein F511_43266 [Dorcoceras hygrometricum]|uniref:Uncharacterized protein n=1 Tax=Dorcoceras hygrometricum TaxID=472368 RepID=A0A2Z7DJ39_9LAMI|nr:hypothetical protein F511_43266 [Dorcoceras hygrometricum]